MKILSVDDSKMVHMVVAKALKNYDVEHISAMNGEEGVAKASSEKPDLILMDITMPVMTGLEAVTKLKADPATAGIPIVMLTAESATDSQTFAFEQGVEKYLTKPFGEDILIATLSSLIPLAPKAA
ncbi:two-component system, cell cycle response regulator/twitching motility two-component system response regulator PilH [Verrucomicrobium sp. GAS474]|uniref:response regulator n=1 Tax=Verrucomicrobium sp. GAS474 TaxID=1882831 RepID=UPI00087AE298|nr:response regulator [Verrucomicrobium sp. GAS474]SDU08148.1 two-component system, cell cycle response regulator/twitching motility two-component system response regulator PilH [Verrucomicrobium sp. GAS474]